VPHGIHPDHRKDENMNLRTRPARTVAAVGVVVAAGTATFMAVAAGTASADEPGHCLQNVNVREEADVNSRIVAMCETGTQVTIGPERDGWAYLENLRGWASRDFIKHDEAPAPAAGETPAPSADSTASSSSSRASSSESASDAPAADAPDADDDATDERSERAGSTDDETPRPRNTTGTGGLLG
jgi:virulence-associated protein VagC